MLVRLDDYYKKYTSGLSEVEIEGTTLGGCLTTLLNAYPQLMVQLMNRNSEVTKTSSFYLEGYGYLVETDSLRLPVTTDSVLSLSSEIPEGSDGRMVGSIVGMVIGAVLVATGYGAGAGIPMLSMTAAQVGMMGVMMMATNVLSIIANYMTQELTSPTSSMGSNSSIGNSAVYTFDGVKNTTAAGTPVYIVYGTHRIGGQVVSLYTEKGEDVVTLVFDTSSYMEIPVITTYYYLYAQLCLCEGEIEDVSDLVINDYPKQFYEGITSCEEEPDYLRKGIADQTAMESFSQIQNSTSISRLITNTAAPIGGEVIEENLEYYPVYGYVQYSDGEVVTGVGYVGPGFKPVFDTAVLTYVQDPPPDPGGGD